MSEHRCRCWGWTQADAFEMDDLIDNGHRKGCLFREETDDVVMELDPELWAEIKASYDEEDE